MSFHLSYHITWRTWILVEVINGEEPVRKNRYGRWDGGRPSKPSVYVYEILKK